MKPSKHRFPVFLVPAVLILSGQAAADVVAGPGPYIGIIGLGLAAVAGIAAVAVFLSAVIVKAYGKRKK